MTKFAKLVGAWITALALASCGGGGGSGNDGGFTAPGLRVAVTPAQTQTTPFSLVDVAVRITSANGAAVADGTQVTLASSSTAVGLVSTVARVGTGPLIGERITALTSGGNATFRFHSRGAGTATLTATAVNVSSGSAQVSATASIAVVAGPSTDPRLRMTPTTTNLPANTFAVAPFYGSPYVADVTIEQRRMDGSLVPDGSVIGVSATPFIDTVNGYSTPDLPGTTANEFEQILNTGTVRTTGGRATIFVHSAQRLASFTITITATDPDTGETLTQSLPFNIIQGSPRLPATVTATRSGIAVYVSNSGGNTTDQIVAVVRDGNGLEVPDPVAGGVAFNNVQVEIIGGAQGGEILQSVNASGSSTSGGTIRTRTVQGVANFNFQAGTRTGPVQIRITADRADNNVDNGISDPVFRVITITVGDGRLFDLDISSPTSENVLDIVFGEAFNNASTGFYQFPVSVIATDRFGNPVVPGTEIRFGVIDSPQTAGQFSIRGNDGDPQELGLNFSAPTGQFQTAGGGAGPGDTLIVFGEESNGNRDLESARRIASVQSNTSLTVTYRFNANDDTGVSVNNGPVLPYIIGRATDATITAAGFTDQNGVASAILSYPANKLGKLTAIHAQGNGDIVGGSPELVTDAEYLRLPGTGPGTLVASPDPIAGNSTLVMDVCLRDATGQPVPGATISFAFEDLFGQGSVNGIQSQGTIATPTGADGCIHPTVVTSGIPPSDTTSDIIPKLRFFIIGSDNGEGDPIQDEVEIRVNTNWFLYAFPSQTRGDGGRIIRLRLVDSSGTPVPNVLIVASCEAEDPATLNIEDHPGNTDANGETTALIDGNGFAIVGDDGPEGSCTFRTINNEAETEVVWTSVDICDQFSPSPPQGCPAATLTVTLIGTGNIASTQPSNALECSGPGNCTARFTPFENVTLLASPTPVSWVGAACSACTGSTCTIALGAEGTNTTCTVTYPP